MKCEKWNIKEQRKENSYITQFCVQIILCVILFFVLKSLKLSLKFWIRAKIYRPTTCWISSSIREQTVGRSIPLHENSEQIPESSCQKNASVSLSQRQMDKYIDLKECAALTRIKLLMCNVCRIKFPNEIVFKTHRIR